MEIGKVYFWTATINKWQHLLWDDQFKEVIIQSLRTLSERGLADIFAFVIMPNHMHLIWRTNALNGKETVQGSLLKFTAHIFKAMLSGNKAELSKYAVNAHNKEYEFWQRDSLAVHLYSRHVMLQKLNYIHLNPLASHWHLADNPWDYYYSSARYYELHEKNFDFLKDVREEF
jgi:REP element-mobilizing transposase RayT